MIRIVIADDHALVREGLRRIIEHHSDLAVAAEADTHDDLFHALGKHEVDVVLMDVSMPELGFLEALERIREDWPHIPVLVVSMHPEEQWAIRAFRSGAAGYLTKRHSAEELAEAIRRVHAGGRYVTPALADALAAQLVSGSEGNAHDALSKREFEVLCMLGSGRMVKRIAADLGLSPKTVSTYRSRILEKLALRSTAEIIRYVVEHDLQR